MSGWRKPIATISRLAKMKRNVKKGPMLDIGPFPSLNGLPLEREEGVVQLHAVTWLLDVGEVTPAAIRNACLGDLLIGHRICSRDILWANDACELYFPNLLIYPDFLPTRDHEVSVWKHLGNDCRNLQVDAFAAIDGAGSGGVRRAIRIHQIRRVDRVR